MGSQGIFLIVVQRRRATAPFVYRKGIFASPPLKIRPVTPVILFSQHRIVNVTFLKFCVTFELAFFLYHEWTLFYISHKKNQWLALLS